MKKLAILLILFIFQGITFAQDQNRTIVFKVDNQSSHDYDVDCGVGRYFFTTGKEHVGSGQSLKMDKALVIGDFASTVCVPDVVAGSCTFACKTPACGDPRKADFNISCAKISDTKTKGRTFEINVKIMDGPKFLIENSDILQ